jgi:hypothetical protein
MSYRNLLRFTWAVLCLLVADVRTYWLQQAWHVTLIGEILWTMFGNYNIKTHRYDSCMTVYFVTERHMLCCNNQLQIWVLCTSIRVLVYKCGPGSCRYSDLLRAGRTGDRIPMGARFFAHVQTDPGGHPASCTMGTEDFPGVKPPERGADHPPPPSTEVENEYSCTSTLLLGPLWPVIGWRLTFISI